MNDLTRILSAIEQGDDQAADELLPLVYDELHKLAAVRLTHEKLGQNLQATELVHEAYLRLVNCSGIPHWNSRGHFFAAADRTKPGAGWPPPCQAHLSIAALTIL